MKQSIVASIQFASKVKIIPVSMASCSAFSDVVSLEWDEIHVHHYCWYVFNSSTTILVHSVSTNRLFTSVAYPQKHLSNVHLNTQTR